MVNVSEKLKTKFHEPKANQMLSASERGFTLIEILVAMAVGLIVLAAMYGVFTVHNKTFSSQEQIAEMQQSARAAMDMMTREIRMAGYDPAGATFDGITYNLSQLQILADLNGDGDTGDPNENIIYTHDDANHQIDRDTGGGKQPFAENIQSFTFDYLDEDGNAATTAALIRQIKITITARTAKPDPGYAQNGGYRTYTLTSVMTPRNLAH